MEAILARKEGCGAHNATLKSATHHKNPKHPRQAGQPPNIMEGQRLARNILSSQIWRSSPNDVFQRCFSRFGHFTVPALLAPHGTCPRFPQLSFPFLTSFPIPSLKKDFEVITSSPSP